MNKHWQTREYPRPDPKEKMLVIDSGLLKSNPTAAMERIHAHLGLDPYDYVANVGTTTADLSRIFDKWYPR